MKRVAILISLIIAVSLLALLAPACAKSAPSPIPSPVPAPAPAPAPATTPAPVPTGPPYYDGKTITVIVSIAAGGGTDAAARLLAKYLPKYIPGNPTIVVTNMPGAGGVIAGNYVYNTSPRDGTVVLGTSGSTALCWFLQQKAVKYDLTKMAAAMLIPSGELCFVRSSKATTLQQVMDNADKIIYGGQALPAGCTITWCLAEELFGFQTKKILAYTGAGDAKRGFLSGEWDAGLWTCTATMESYGDLLKDGTITLLFQGGLLDGTGNVIRDTVAPADVPTMKEVYTKMRGKAPSGSYWDMYVGYLLAARTPCWGYLFPPDCDKYAAILRAAAEKMWAEDKGFKEGYAKLFGDTPMFVGDAVLSLQKQTAEKAAPVVKPLQDWLHDKYKVEF